MGWVIEGGTALVDGHLGPSPVHVSGEAIADRPGLAAQRLDASGLLVLPGIVDLHGDGFERQVMPRPGVRFDLGIALRDTDRQLVANGITTCFHGVTVSWEPGLRSLASAQRLVEAVMALRPVLACDTRLHLRWETFALDEAPAVRDWLGLEPRPILAFNDHTTGTRNNGHTKRKLGQMAERSGLTPEAYSALMEVAWARRGEVAAGVDAMAAAARERGNILLAHDEASPADRERFRALGVRASEFPLTVETARAARDRGEHVILGAPNVVRGGSHNGALDATAAVDAGLCTVLASDYYYPAPLHAAFAMLHRGLELPAAWALVSAHPAAVAGLADRGSLRPGQRADLILVDPSDPAHPRVVLAMVRGRIAFSGLDPVRFDVGGRAASRAA